ncbi:MAG: tRNA pseudouridine(55) synthase TruB [Planctomycetota bacterium]
MGRSPRYRTQRDGVLVVDKPVGVSSADVVRAVRFGAGDCKTGHAGTLDPLASGVLVCCLGAATKLSDRLMAGVKAYETEVDLAAFTTTDDREGERAEVAIDPGGRPDAARLREALSGFVGVIDQTPPAYSAAHVGGRRAYALARRGEAVELEPRRVRIDAIDLVSLDWPIARLVVTCGKGVYIRSLARDLGVAMGTGGHLASLRRTRVGPFTIEGARPMSTIEPDSLVDDDLLSMARVEAMLAAAADDQSSSGGALP